MNVFIDTNVFLSFFHFSSDDLEELRKLTVLIEENQIRLLLPEQVRDEFWRNRESKIAEAVKILRQQKFSAQFPAICKDYEHYVALRRLFRQYEETHSELLSEITRDEAQLNLKADQVVKEIFRLSDLIVRTEELVRNAEVRLSVGNPPGKRGSLGDAINWLSVIEATAQGEDLHFISDDGDFASATDHDRFDRFLLDEWTDAKASQLFFYKRLSDFFQQHHPDIRLARELQKDLLIGELAESSNFSTTHRLIARLRALGEFSSTQANAIVDAALANLQVRWIIHDNDVFAFLTQLADDHADDLDEDLLSILQAELSGEGEE